MDDIKIINRNELTLLLDHDPNIKIVDVLDSDHFAKEHIKNALSLPLQEVRTKAIKLLKKDDTIITYCANFDCPASTKAAKILQSMGYKYVLDYKGGLDDYKVVELPLEGSFH
jgi:rhodanese-related sulfurtransferase